MRAHFFTPTSWFDKFLSAYRYSRVFQVLKQNTQICSIIDMGCGSGQLVSRLQQRGFDAKGIDVNPGEHIIASDLNHPLPLADNSIDFVTSLANLEHLDQPDVNLREIYRILKKGGTCVLTTPSTAAKPVLEFLAFRLKLIDRREIEDHKRYFSKALLQQSFRQAGFDTISVRYFQMGLNLHAVAIK